MLGIKKDLVTIDCERYRVLVINFPDVVFCKEEGVSSQNMCATNIISKLYNVYMLIKFIQ